ncbi:MAG TPA: GNAT family N-acetyltransferase [Holophagaceae bacterium]|nr:GNAT family N-acetyltransferase [Holophagaceae bacterium]
MASTAPIVSAFQIVTLGRKDIPQMLALFREAIPRPQLDRSTYTAPGVERYLGHLFDFPELQRQEQLWGLADPGGDFAAVAHTRRIGHHLHLNNAAVRPALQGQGLGGRLLARWEAMAREAKVAGISLDVALENKGALRHYQRFGLEEVTVAYEGQLMEPISDDAGDEVSLVDWPAAQVSLDAFGFGRFQLVLEGHPHFVDVTEARFRVGNSDPRVLAALHRIDPDRAIFLRSHTPFPAGKWKPTGAIIRMIKDF